MPYQVADLFCGAGGLSFGFAYNDSFHIAFANDNDKHAIESYKANHPSTITCLKDIAHLHNELYSHKIDVVVGGAPCQSYSTLGKRQMDDRAYLFKEYLRVVETLQPKILLFENVKGLLSMQKKQLFKHILGEIERLGYHTYFKVLNATDYGVPQQRERLFIVGIHRLSFIGAFEFPKPTATRPVTLAEAIGDLPELCCGESLNIPYTYEPYNEFLEFVMLDSLAITEHDAPQCNDGLKLIMQTLKDGEDKYALPEDIRPKTGYTNTYAKLWWNKPSITITRNFSTPSSSRCIHPRDSRPLTIREGARLQSFPDWYQFKGTATSKRLQIGNAVPPLVSIALANAIRDYLDRVCRMGKEQ